MVRIRLKRVGRRHLPCYRICVMDSRSPRDGKAIEEIGTYQPCNKDEAQQCTVNVERAEHWLKTGAQPSETVASLLKKNGVAI